MKLEFSWQIFKKSSNIEFHENLFSGKQVVPCGQTYIRKLIVAFQSFVNPPKNVWKNFTDAVKYDYHYKVVYYMNCTYGHVHVIDNLQMGYCQAVKMLKI